MRKTSLVLILFTVWFLNCKNQSKNEFLTITQKIMFSSPITTNGESSFPLDIQNLCMPFVSFKKRALVLDPTISTTFSRIDLKQPFEQKFELKKTEASKIQEFLKAKSIERLRERVKETFSDLKVGTDFSQKSNVNALESISNYLNENQSSVILVYSPQVKSGTINLNSKDFPLYNNIDSLRSKISDLLDENNNQEISILYNPNMPPVPQNDNNNQKIPPITSRVNFDELFNKYLEFKKQNHTPQELITYLNNLRTTNAAVNPAILQDYRFVYEIGLTFAYMGVQNHDMCFSVLADAAEIAIANHKGKDMHKWINRDEDGDLHKESHHSEFKIIHDSTENENAIGLVRIKRIRNLYQPHVE